MAGRKKTETVEAEVVETAVVPAGKMEFRLINPTEDGFLRRIQWNKEELEAAVRAKIAGYENVVYTEENIKAAKNDRAELNKLIKAIEERRKQVKNIINKPYAVFEEELKEITALINEPVALIDKQVKAFEEKQKEEKKAAIKATYDENIGDLAEVLTFEKIFDSRYLNQTYKLATAQKEIVDKIDTVKTDLETIDSLDSKYKLNAKDVYIKTLDLSKALAENKRLADLEEKLEADKRRKAEEEAERKRQEEIRKQKEAEGQAKREAEEAERKAAEAKKAQESAAEVEQTAPQSEMGKVIESIERSAFAQAVAGDVQSEPGEQAVDPFAPKAETKQEKKYRVRFYADGTKEQLAKLVEFLNENNIKYGKIAKESK